MTRYLMLRQKFSTEQTVVNLLQLFSMTSSTLRKVTKLKIKLLCGSTC